MSLETSELTLEKRLFINTFINIFLTELSRTDPSLAYRTPAEGLERAYNIRADLLPSIGEADLTRWGLRRDAELSGFTSEGLDYLISEGIVKRPLVLGPERTVEKSRYQLTEEGILTLLGYASSPDVPIYS